MEKITFDIEGLILIKPRVFFDSRGFFFESFNHARYQEILGDNIEFVQDNISSSSKNVLRGLHFQSPPMAQGKLVTVLSGAVLDIAVDLRKESPTYGKHHSVELTAANKYQFWIPPGFAHGFVSLSDDTLFSYKCTNYYAAIHENTLMWNDPDLNINWQSENPLISDKDSLGISFKQFETPF
jgi:dTDP-4-dehydrorhamnose 3,5-epimerase